jgi:hypothetical protein
VYLGRGLALLLSNLVKDWREGPIGLGRKGDQGSISLEKDVVLCEILAQLVLLKVGMELDLIDHGLVFRNVENRFQIFDPEIGNANALGKTYSVRILK